MGFTLTSIVDRLLSPTRSTPFLGALIAKEPSVLVLVISFAPFTLIKAAVLLPSASFTTPTTAVSYTHLTLPTNSLV